MRVETLCRIETGKHTPSVPTVEKIDQALKRYAKPKAKRVMPAVLRRLMRHSSIATTMGYYVDLDSAEVADQLWAGWGDSTGNTPAADNTVDNTRPERAENEESPIVASDYRA